MSLRPIEIFEGLLVGAVMAAVLLVEAFVYQRQNGTTLLEDLKEVWPRAWDVLLYASPVIFAALAAFGFVRGHSLVAWAGGVLTLVSGITVAWWSIGRAKPPGEDR